MHHVQQFQHLKTVKSWCFNRVPLRNDILCKLCFLSIPFIWAFNHHPFASAILRVMTCTSKTAFVHISDPQSVSQTRVIGGEEALPPTPPTIPSTTCLAFRKTSVSDLPRAPARQRETRLSSRGHGVDLIFTNISTA